MAALKNITDQDKKLNDKLYDEYHSLGMEDGWHKGNKEENYRLMVKIAQFSGIPLQGSSCLDVGCGSGDFSQYLKTHGAKQYLGLDIYEPSLGKARSKYPTENFIYGDLLEKDFSQKFDFTFCSGALTVKLHENNYDFLESMISKMWKLTNIGIVFNVLTDDDRDWDPDLFFYSPFTVSLICKTIDPEAKLIIEKTPRKAQIHVYMYR